MDSPASGQVDNGLDVFGCQGRHVFLHPGLECTVLFMICNQYRIQIMPRNRPYRALVVCTVRSVDTRCQCVGHQRVSLVVPQSDVLLVEAIVGHFYSRMTCVNAENRSAVYHVSHSVCFT